MSTLVELQALRNAAAEIGNFTAPFGYVFVCTACGRRSLDKYGEQAFSRWWDESCVLNAALYPVDCLTLTEEGIVVALREPAA
jgi:hypothetical protein